MNSASGFLNQLLNFSFLILLNKKKLNKYSFDFSIYVFFFDKRLQTHGSVFDKLILGGRIIILNETTPLQIFSITQINSKVRYFILESFHKLVYFLSGKFHPICKITTFQTYMHPSKSPKKHKPKNTLF